MKIFILHRHDYWTDYLQFLLEDERFELVASKFAINRNYKGKQLDLFDPTKHHQILTPGIVDDETKKNRLHLRSLHSPGFYIATHLINYQGMTQYHADSDFTMSILESHYKALVMREIKHPQLDEIRYKLIHDKRVHLTKINLDLYRFLQDKQLSNRTAGTGLICMSWFFMFVNEEKIKDIFSFLAKELKLTLVIHPCTQSQLFIEKMKELKGTFFDQVYFNLDRDKMTELYDKNEFIITDGSGSTYEAMFRGCKPLSIKGLYKDHAQDMAMQLAYDELEDEYFPFQSYKEISTFNNFDNEKFLKYHYPFVYEFTYSEAKEIVKKEIISLFN